MKKIIFAFILVLCMGCFFGCGTTEIDINSYINVEFDGYDTLGRISKYEFDAKQMLSDYEKPLENASKKDIETLLANAFEFEKDSNLENGDKINVTWDIDEDDLLEFEEDNKVKLIFDEYSVKVSGLQSLEYFDPFENISVKYEGVAPYTYAYVEKNMERGEMGYNDFYYTMDKSDNLSNGDVITVEVYSSRGEDFKTYCIEKYGKIPNTVKKEIKVSGCAEYVKDIKDISAADKIIISDYIKSHLKSKTENWMFPESFCGMTSMGNIFVYTKEKQSYYTTNKIFFVYKVDVDSVRDGAFSSYFCGSIDDLYFDKDGKLVYDLDDVRMSEITSSGWFMSGTYFKYADLNYDGYLTYDKLYEDEIKPLEESYTITDDIDKTIITKVTHEPKDYSVITAKLNLAADCFNYKWYQGSYYVAGFTEKGYQELIKNKASDYVSIQLPAYTADGSEVEGVYSSKNEGGYSFSTVLTAEVPCIQLVCADGYKDFYGFCDDNKFSSDYGFKLKSVVLNEGIKTIYKNAFRNCTGITGVVIPNSVEEIGENAFYNCSRLLVDKLEIENLKIGVNAFYGVTINSVTLRGDDYIPVRQAFREAVIKNIVIADTVTKIPAYAFEEANGYTEIALPASVKEIGELAFAYNEDLTKVTLSGVEQIGDEAFYKCTALVIDKLDFTDMSIGYNAFSGATIKEAVLSSDNFVSKRYTSWSSVYTQWKGATVQKITVSEGVTAIPDYAFEYCEGVTDIVLPSTVKKIGTGAFSNSTTLKTVTLNEGLEEIGAEAFKKCTNLKTINIPSTVKKIDTDAFHSCEYLLIDKIDISGMTINTYAFYQATIKEVVLDSNEFTSLRFTSWGTLYSPWTGAFVKQITITENVTELPAYAFEDITSLDEITIPASVTKIGESVFRECTSIKRINIPASVKEIGKDAFLENKELTIIAPKDSFAEKYASDNNIKFSVAN